jgi:hypothetical protein
MWKKTEGSTDQLLQFCSVYFLAYVATGVMVKYFLGPASAGFPGLKDLEFTVYNTSASVVVTLGVSFVLGWFRMASNRTVHFGPIHFPSELFYIVPSGICAAVVIPTTTLMYTLPISVMVAMVIMRGAVIVISRVVDAVQIHQGILKREVYWEENVAVVFALIAMGMNILLKPAKGAFDFVHSRPAMVILGAYIVAYALRIYIMNYYKNTRAPGVKQDNPGFFAFEQLSAAVTMLVACCLIFFSPDLFGWSNPQVEIYRQAIMEPRPMWGWALMSGLAYSLVAFVSVFIFMFKGRTATFAGLVNRLTSLVAGTTATLVFAKAFGGKMPSLEDWYSLASILVAVGFLTRAEKKRAAELIRTNEIAGAK